MRKVFAVLIAVLALASSALAQAPAARILYDSGSVAAGAAIESPVLNLERAQVSEIEVLVDHTAGLGTVSRDLSLTTYLDDGTTAIETVLLHRIWGGAAANGADYAPGRVRGYIGPRPPGPVTGTHTLYDVTSPVNTALDTGPLSVEDTEAVLADALATGGTTQVTASIVWDDAVATAMTVPPAAAVHQASSWGAGYTVVPTGFTATSVVPLPVPRRLKYQTTAGGAGIAVRLRVVARGRPPGTFALQMILPARLKLSLAAGGAAAGRVVVLGL